MEKKNIKEDICVYLGEGMLACGALLDIAGHPETGVPIFVLGGTITLESLRRKVAKVI